MNMLEKNMLHGSGVFVSKNFCGNGSKENYYCKSSSTQNGIINILKEFEGYSWYAKSSDYDFNLSVVFRTDNYIKIKYPYVCGILPDPELRYLSCTDLIEEVLAHYVHVWSGYKSSELAPVHGDLHLEGNIIFTENGPFILDWEHFNKGIAPIGFDALFFLFQKIYTSSLKEKISEESLIHVKKMILYLEGHNCISKTYSSGYLFNLIRIIDDIDDLIWGEQKSKIPIVKFSKSEIDFIDERLS